MSESAGEIVPPCPNCADGCIAASSRFWSVDAMRPAVSPGALRRESREERLSGRAPAAEAVALQRAIDDDEAAAAADGDAPSRATRARPPERRRPSPPRASKVFGSSSWRMIAEIEKSYGARRWRRR